MVLQALGNLLQLGVNKALTAAVPVALNVGTQFVTGLVTRELNRSARNDSDDAFKALIRAAANAVSPTAALGQTAVPAGGPVTGTAFDPPTLIPPSIQPANRVLQTNPDFFPRNQTFTASRRPPEVFLGDSQPVGFAGAALRGLRSFGRAARSAPKAIRGTAGKFDPRTPIGRRMLGTGAAAVAAETAASAGLDAIFNPSQAFAPTNGFPTSGNFLRV